jgi:hypothetical protein
MLMPTALAASSMLRCVSSAAIASSFLRSNFPPRLGAVGTQTAVTLDVCQTLFRSALDIHGEVANRWTFTAPDLTSLNRRSEVC